MASVFVCASVGHMVLTEQSHKTSLDSQNISMACRFMKFICKNSNYNSCFLLWYVIIMLAIYVLLLLNCSLIDVTWNAQFVVTMVLLLYKLNKDIMVTTVNPTLLFIKGTTLEYFVFLERLLDLIVLLFKVILM